MMGIISKDKMRSILKSLTTTNSSLVKISKENHIEYSILSGIVEALENIDIIKEYDLSNIKNRKAVRQYSNDTVILICELLENTFIGNSDISNTLGISRSIISNIRNGICYADISCKYDVKECPSLKLIKSTNKYSSIKREILNKAKTRADKLKENNNFYSKVVF